MGSDGDAQPGPARRPAEAAPRAVSRRAFVRATGTAAVTATGAAALSRPAAAAEYEPRDDVTYGFDDADDAALLERWQPELVMSHLGVRPSGTHAMVCRGEWHGTVCLQYWQVYPVQEGVTSADSHLGDHEPIYVFLRPDGSGGYELEEVVYSAYHWFAGRRTNPPRVADEVRPKGYVWEPHHQHSFERPEIAKYPGERPDLVDFRETYPRWLDNGARGVIADGVVYDPWVMKGLDGRPSWWDKTGLNLVDKYLYQFYLMLGFGQAGASDIA